MKLRKDRHGQTTSVNAHTYGTSPNDGVVYPNSTQILSVSNTVSRTLTVTHATGTITQVTDGNGRTLLAPTTSAGTTDPAGNLTTFAYLVPQTTSPLQRPVPYQQLSQVSRGPQKRLSLRVLEFLVLATSSSASKWRSPVWRWETVGLGLRNFPRLWKVVARAGGVHGARAQSRRTAALSLSPLLRVAVCGNWIGTVGWA